MKNSYVSSYIRVLHYRLFYIVLTLLMCLPKIKAQGVQSITAKMYSQVMPVFKNYDNNPAIQLSIHNPLTTASEQYLQTIQCLLDKNGFESIEFIEVYETGAEPFHKQNLLTKVKPGAKSFAIEIKKLLKTGVSNYWLNVILKPSASIDQTLTLTCTSVVVNKKVLIPVLALGKGYTKRIGIAVRKEGDDAVNTYRIPGIVQTDKGSLLAVYDIRYKNSADLPGNIDVGLSKSIDSGKTWEPMRVIMDMGEPHENNGVGDPAILFDPVTKTIWVAALWSKGNRSIAGSKPGLSPDTTGQLVIVSSQDDGLTWTKPVSITPVVKNPGWHLFFNGPGTGIAMKDGTLVFAAQYWDENRKPYSTIIYSKDHGANWTGHIKGPKENTTESQVVEIAPGELMLNMRDNRGAFRSVATTINLGQSWTEHPSSYNTLIDPVCMASIITQNIMYKNNKKEVLFFSNPNTISGRYNMSIRASLDKGNTWPDRYRLLIDERIGFGYSSLTRIDNQTIGILYEGVKSLLFVPVPIQEILP